MGFVEISERAKMGSSDGATVGQIRQASSKKAGGVGSLGTLGWLSFSGLWGTNNGWNLI